MLSSKCLINYGKPRKWIYKFLIDIRSIGWLIDWLAWPIDLTHWLDWLTSYTYSYLANVIFWHKYVPGCKVAMYKWLSSKVAHSSCYLSGEAQEYSWHFRRKIISWSAGKHEETIHEEASSLVIDLWQHVSLVTCCISLIRCCGYYFFRCLF